MSVPTTRYARRGESHIAYQVVGDGPFDVVMVPGFVSNVEAFWENPVLAEMGRRMTLYARLILWDKRGTGLSDPVVGVPAIDERMDDLRAVMDAAGSAEASLMGVSEGGPMSILFAATYPERVRSLILYGTTPRFTSGPGYPYGWSPEEFETMLAAIEHDWGNAALIDRFAPSVADDPQARDAWSRYQRASASPGMARSVIQALADIDVRAILPTVQAPCLILHRTDERIANVGGARLMADLIPDAKLVELPGQDHLPFVGDWEAIVDETEEFLTGRRSARPSDRVLATVLFTDIVASTERAAALGDRAWRDVLEQHDVAVRRQLAAFRGREIKQTGDGFLAAFDGPARAVECATSLADTVRPLGIEIRAGVHTGECEQRGQDLGGIGVHIGARIAALAGPGEVLTSSTVRDLVAGSGLQFVDRGPHDLKGVPDRWNLYAVR